MSCLESGILGSIPESVAFVKTPKQIRIAVLSVCFKIGLKSQVKKSEISNFLPNYTFLPKLQTVRNRSWVCC